MLMPGRVISQANDVPRGADPSREVCSYRHVAACTFLSLLAYVVIREPQRESRI